jgi:arylsulfatase A-like enzyme
MTKPANLIVFLTDNHAAAVTGCYGHPIVQTPNIDRIAAGGCLLREPPLLSLSRGDSDRAVPA